VPEISGARFLVVDEEALFRFGVAGALGSLGPVDHTSHGHEAVKRADEFTVVLIATPSDMPRVELARRLRARDPALCVVVLLPEATSQELGALIALPVDGLLSRTTGPDALALACGRVLGGERALDPQLLALGHEARERRAPEAFVLTARERDVLVLLAGGRSNREIAASLFVSLPTVKTHLAHIYGKLDARNRNEALGRAMALGLVT
jgi:DNA-binding NarL/FixJ family response regulator